MSRRRRRLLIEVLGKRSAGGRPPDAEADTPFVLPRGGLAMAGLVVVVIAGVSAVWWNQARKKAPADDSATLSAVTPGDAVETPGAPAADAPQGDPAYVIDLLEMKWKTPAERPQVDREMCALAEDLCRVFPTELPGLFARKVKARNAWVLYCGGAANRADLVPLLDRVQNLSYKGRKPFAKATRTSPEK